jgi:cytoskeleton protein RodZ
MSSFGANLKREREARGISLQDISDQTKIGVRLLKAIENEQLDQLPGGIFVKSFLRQYARYVSLDEEQIIAEYLQAIGSGPEASPLPSASRSGEKNTSASAFSITAPAAMPDSEPASGYPRLILTAVGVGVAVVGVFYGIRQFTEHRWRGAARGPAAAQTAPVSASQEPPEPPAFAPTPGAIADSNPALSPSPSAPSFPGPGPEQLTPNAVVGPGPSGAPQRVANAGNAANGVMNSTAPKAAPLAAAAPAGNPRADAGSPDVAGGLALEISARKDCWVSISADGQKQWQGTLKAEGLRRVQARESVQLTLGDAGAVTLTLNGKSLPPVGRLGEVKTLTISSRNLPATEP